jgi:hypothetical protein
MTTKITIKNEKNCSWCEVNGGTYIYGKNEAEVIASLECLQKSRRLLPTEER